MIRVAFDVHHLRSYVLGFVAERMDDNAAANRAISASRSRFDDPRNLQFPGLRIDFLEKGKNA
jgi:hypothetical protein